MRMNKSIPVLIFMLLFSCINPVNDFDRVHALFDIEEEVDWVVIVNTPSCKTCLFEFYEKLNGLCLSGGKLIVVSGSKKEIENTVRDVYPCLDIIIDDQKKLSLENFFLFSDELILMTKSKVIKDSASDYFNITRHLVSDK